VLNYLHHNSNMLSDMSRNEVMVHIQELIIFYQLMENKKIWVAFHILDIFNTESKTKSGYRSCYDAYKIRDY